MEFGRGIENLIINGGSFVSLTSYGFNTLHSNIATGAFHDSGERFDPPKCHPKTRVAVLAEIMQWIQHIEGSERVLWLYGSAGAGKSAIAQSIAEMCAKLNLLVASFFFSRSSQFRNNEKRLIASLAYQLALSIPATRTYIDSAVQIDPAIFDRSLNTQIETLITRPLESACTVANLAIVKEWPRLILIDGLDECDGPSIQSSIIRALSTTLLRMPLSLVLLISSRPEPNIRNTFNLLNKSHVSRHIILNDSYKPDADIKEFFLSRFTEIKENHQLAAYIPQTWPSEEVIDGLVRKASGQFIYASTVMKYLDSPDRWPMKRLDGIMGLRPVDGDIPYKELDALYNHIFSCVEDISTVLKILGFLFFSCNQGSKPITMDFLALLLGSDEEDVHISLSGLHSILYIPPPKTSESGIQTTHASVQDFLVDKLRSGKHYLDEEAFHTDLAQQCLHQISTLPLNVIEQSCSRLRGSPSCEKYLICCLIYHCTRASTDSVDLKNALMQVRNLQPWFEIWSPFRYKDLQVLFAWLHKVDMPAREPLSHIQSLWDQYLITKLNEHTFNGSNVDIAGLLFFPDTWQSCWFSLISGASQVPDIFNGFKYVTWSSLDGDAGKFRLFLTEFFEDRNRSGKYYLDGTVYAHAALECLQNMVNPNDDEIFNPYAFVMERPEANLFMSITEDISSQREILVPSYQEGIDALSKILLKAAPITDLYFHLRDHPLHDPAKATIHCKDGLASLRSAVKDYLDKCKHLCPKIVSRLY